MSRKAGRVVTTALLAMALVGCATGRVTGRVTEPGQPASPLDMAWESGVFGESGKMAAVMPDGERFSGTYQVVKKGMSWTKIPPDWKVSGSAAQGDLANRDGLFGAAADPERFISAHLNKAIATLKGDRGTTMLCRFNLDAGESGMGGGGSGECQTSKGAKITAQF